MDEIPLSTQFLVLAGLIVCSAFFSMAETAMMACNRIRLRHRAAEGSRGARLAVALLAKTDQLLGVILLGNTLINSLAAMLTGTIALQVFGGEDWALEAGALFVTFCLLVFSEISPKVIGATHPDWLVPRISFVLTPLLRIAYPVVWFVNLFVGALLRSVNLQPKPGHEATGLSSEELRAVVLESGHLMPHQHRDILFNLFELKHVSVADIMSPRGEIEAIDISAPIEELLEQLSTSYHSRVVVYEDEPGNILGILKHRQLVPDAFAGKVDHATLRAQLSEPYYVPSATPIFSQMQFFRENRQRLGLVVDEYGEIEGLITLEDIVEEIIGKFTTSGPGSTNALAWDADGTVLVDGMVGLRELNRLLALDLPTDGARTLNGLVTEHLRDIPEVGVSVRISGVAMEIIQTQDRKVKMLKLHRPASQ
ncbi:MAG: DUF21 domain-containing protein [Rhodocyclaceae bacterium]|nr:DUF21 domain-containing protein [Rhodocyclaceae bacterium]MBP7080720.1 DUF21 domain-containing protein [Rhodocyclaceae bacterium]